MSELIVNKSFKVYNTNSQGTEDISTAASTWGELKNQLNIPDNMEVFLKDASTNERYMLKFPETKLPEKGYIVITPTKVASGVDYTKVGFNDLRKIAKEKLIPYTLGANPTRNQLVEALNATLVEKPKKEATVIVKEEIKKNKEESITNDLNLANRVAFLERKFIQIFGGSLMEEEIEKVITSVKQAKIEKEIELSNNDMLAFAKSIK